MINLYHRYANQLRAGMMIDVSVEPGVYTLRKIVSVAPSSGDLVEIGLSDRTILAKTTSSWYVEE